MIGETSESRARELRHWLVYELYRLEGEVDDGAAQRVRKIRRVADEDLHEITLAAEAEGRELYQARQEIRLLEGR